VLEGGGLGDAQHRVHVLDRLVRGALDQIVKVRAPRIDYGDCVATRGGPFGRESRFGSVFLSEPGINPRQRNGLFPIFRGAYASRRSTILAGTRAPESRTAD